MSTPENGPTLGPCDAWITGSDVAKCCGVGEDCDPPSLFDTVALEASMALYEISGRLWTGVCEKTVRPCSDPCNCWGQPSLGLAPYFWTSVPYAVGGWYWRNECGDRCGCGSLSQVKLPGYPVRQITEVKIDGEVLPYYDDNGNKNYRLDGYQFLTRMDDPGPPQQPRRWPACQNMALDDTELGTFSVSYEWGVDPPPLGQEAAAELACQLAAQCQGDDCMLPAGATRIVRQGIEIDRGLLANWFDPTKSTGLVKLDMFLKAYWPSRSRRRPLVYSPDLQRYARTVGSP